MTLAELEAAMDELQAAAVSEADPHWSGRGAEERIAAARKAIVDAFPKWTIRGGELTHD